MRAHVIKNGKVDNTILVNALEDAEALGLMLVDGEAGGEIGDVYSNGTFTKPVMPFDRAEASKKIDSAVEAIYARPMTLAKEYEQREAQAQEYKGGGYVGNPKGRVKAFADAAGMSYVAATDLILSQAATIRDALDSLSDLRMKKYEITRTASDATARTMFNTVMAQIAAIGAALA